MGFEEGLEHKYGVQVWVHGSQNEGYLQNEKQKVNALFIGPMAESIRESGETWKQHGFSITGMQNSKTRFLNGSNWLPNMANKKSSRWLLSCLNTGKNACQTVWGDGLRTGAEEFPTRFKSERDLLFPF